MLVILHKSSVLRLVIFLGETFFEEKGFPDLLKQVGAEHPSKNLFKKGFDEVRLTPWREIHVGAGQLFTIHS